MIISSLRQWTPAFRYSLPSCSSRYTFASHLSAVIQGLRNKSSSSSTCPYEVLCLDKLASSDQIKKNYYALSKIYHPDRNRGREAEVAFREVAKAYEILGNPARKQAYDEEVGTGYTKEVCRIPYSCTI